MSEAMAHKRPALLNTLIYGFIVLWVILAAVPFLWTVWGSFKVEADFFSRESWWNAILGPATIRETGAAFTGDGYYGAWITRDFWKAAFNTIIVTICVTTISLTLGTLGGYALARSGKNYAFWILIAALVFRAMPHITLVSGYLLPFFQLNIWGVARGSLGSATIGYWVSERFAGRGITPTAVAMATDAAFDQFGLHRMEICIRPENRASLRVVEKLGFRYEGLRRRYIHIDGDWRDHFAFALVAEEVPGGVLRRWREGRAPSGAASIPAADREAALTPLRVGDR